MRYHPSITWSKTSLLSNVFAVWNWLVGRPHGIQVRAWTASDGVNTTREFYSYQSLAVYLESQLYEHVSSILKGPLSWWQDLKRVRVVVPVFSDYTPQYPGYVFAIVVGDTSSGSAATTGTSVSFSHTVNSGESLIAGATMRYGVAGCINDATYNAVTMSEAVRYSNGYSSVIYYATAPSTGSNTLSVSFDVDNRSKVATAVSIAGADTSDFIEATQTIYSGSNTDVSGTVTTAAAGAFGYFVMCTAPTTTFTSDAGQTDLYNGAVSGEAFASTHVHSYEIFSSSGSNEMGGTLSVAREFSGAVVAVNAASSTSVKTWDGVARASVKTLLGVASANIKTINGVT